MLVSSIISQIREVTGQSDQALNFQALTRAIELLANEGLFDPLIGYVNFGNTTTNLVALPREVKTALRVNINKQPTLLRNRIFEFALNGPGSDDTDEPTLTWSDRGYSPIQNEYRLPGTLAYVCEDPADVGKTITIYGKGLEGREVKTTLKATTQLDAALGDVEVWEVTKVVREETQGITLLYCAGLTDDRLTAQYYPDETVPSYRVIKLAKTVCDVRIMFRRDVYEIRSLVDTVPLHSKMAVIHATKAVRYYADDEYEKGDAALARAKDFIAKEQAARDEHDTLASRFEVSTMTDTSINVRDGIVVGDVYDLACDIFGFRGRQKILDRVTMAVEVLRNKAQWDAGTGVVDIWLPDQTEDVTIPQKKGDGYYVLPRFVESVISLNKCDAPNIPRNRWFEFHLNGSGSRNKADGGTWDDAGETCLSRAFQIDPETNKVIPVRFAAIPYFEADNNKEIRLFGYERLADGTEVEVWRNNERGYVIPCSIGQITILSDAPRWVRVDRIVKAETQGYVQMFSMDEASPASPVLQFGFFYPDEVEPKYRAIRVSSTKEQRIRVLYRRRITKFTSLFEPIPLRSRIAIENMFRAMKAQEANDAATAQTFEELAVGYLSEERINSVPSDTGSLQFDESTMPGVRGNVM